MGTHLNHGMLLCGQLLVSGEALEVVLHVAHRVRLAAASKERLNSSFALYSLFFRALLPFCWLCDLGSAISIRKRL